MILLARDHNTHLRLVRLLPCAALALFEAPGTIPGQPASPSSHSPSIMRESHSALGLFFPKDKNRHFFRSSAADAADGLVLVLFVRWFEDNGEQGNETDGRFIVHCRL